VSKEPEDITWPGMLRYLPQSCAKMFVDLIEKEHDPAMMNAIVKEIGQRQKKFAVEDWGHYMRWIAKLQGFPDPYNKDWR